MHFLVLAYDGNDDKALERRLAFRQAHLDMGAECCEAGQRLYSAAILDDAGKMIGSAVFCDYPSRKELDAWLKEEPYILGNVWQKIEVQPCQISSSFLKPQAAVAK